MDLARTATATWTPDEPHTRLAALAGRWKGRTRIWLEPTSTPEEAETSLEAQPILGGRFLRLSYVSIAGGQPHAGEYTLGWDQNERRWTLAWVDSFHMGTGVMLSLGAVGDAGPMVVYGDYLAGTERWGWRTAILPEGPHRLKIEMFNSWPGHADYLGVQSILERVAE